MGAFYVDDSKRREIRVYDVGSDGALRNGRLFGKEQSTARRAGVPDGVRVDTKGNSLSPDRRACGCGMLTVIVLARDLRSAARELRWWRVAVESG